MQNTIRNQVASASSIYNPKHESFGGTKICHSGAKLGVENSWENAQKVLKLI